MTPEPDPLAAPAESTFEAFGLDGAVLALFRSLEIRIIDTDFFEEVLRPFSSLHWFNDPAVALQRDRDLTFAGVQFAIRMNGREAVAAHEYVIVVSRIPLATSSQTLT